MSTKCCNFCFLLTNTWVIWFSKPISLVFGPPFVKWFALCYQTVVLSVCLSCLSVTLVYCDQTVGWIKTKLGMAVGLGHPDNTVVDGDPATPSQKGHSPHNFRPVSVVAKRLDASRCHLVRRHASALAHCVRQRPRSIFGPCLIVAKRSPISATAELLSHCPSCPWSVSKLILYQTILCIICRFFSSLQLLPLLLSLTSDNKRIAHFAIRSAWWVRSKVTDPKMRQFLWWRQQQLRLE